jgi:hypothetical protein
MRLSYCQNIRPGTLRQTLREKWPEATRSFHDRRDLYFATGLPQLDRIFPKACGLPCGQLIEITGGLSSGKTSLLYCLLTTASADGRTIVYVDFDNAFFPDTTPGSTLQLSQLLVVQPADTAPDSLRAGLRTAELLLRDRRADIIVFDLIGRHIPLPLGLLHRLRLKTVRAKGLVIFLTQKTKADIIPSSMAALRLEVRRADRTDQNRLNITVTKSRLCAEGIQMEVRL